MQLKQKRYSLKIQHTNKFKAHVSSCTVPVRDVLLQIEINPIFGKV